MTVTLLLTFLVIADVLVVILVGVDIFGSVWSAVGGNIKASQSATYKRPCDGVDQHRKYLDVWRTASDNRKEIE